MSTHTQNSAPSTVSSRQEPLSGIRGAALAGLEAWLRSRIDLIALLAVAVGFVIRIMAAAGSYLYPDEALHFLLSNQRSVIHVYKASLTSAHPPLFFLLLHVCRFLGNSEFILRLPSVVAGTVLLWVAFTWLGKTFGQTAGVIGLLLLAFSPPMILLSAEIRGYTVFLLFAAAALSFLERAIDEKSPRMMALFSLFLYLAILTEYSALWFTLALGVYALMRIIARQLPAEVLKVWVMSQAGAAALYAFLYVTHISKLRGGGMEEVAMSGWLHHSYFQSGKDSLLLFPLTRSVEVFQYLFGHQGVGVAMLVCFLVGLASLFAKGVPRNHGRPDRWDLGVLLLLPFVFGSGAGILGVYPYGGSRHTVFLVLFATAGVSFLLARLAARKTWPVLLAVGVVLPIWSLNATPLAQFIHPQTQRQVLMSRAVNYIRQSVPPGGLLFVDHETSLMLGYYLSKDQIVRFDQPQPRKDFLEYPYGGYRVVSSKVWLFDAKSFGAELAKMKVAYGLESGELVWVAQAGWGVNLYLELTRRFPGAYFPGLIFGGNLAVFQVPASLVPLTKNIDRQQRNGDVPFPQRAQ